jgi:predicted permease
VGRRDAWKIASVAYRELGFQAIYALRHGNLPPEMDPQDLQKRSRRLVLESKIIVSLLLIVMGLGGGFALTPTVQAFLAPAATPGLYQVSLLAALLLLQLSFLWTTGIQVLPTLLGSRILPTLEMLPLPERDLDWAGCFLFLRLFDLPALAIIVATPLGVGLALGSPLAGLALLPGAIGVVVLALVLALETGYAFVRRVQGSPTGARASVLRWTFLVLWTIPAFAIYGFLSFSPEFLRGLSALAVANPDAAVAVLAIFPFPLALLPVLVAGLLGPGVAIGVPLPAVGLLLALALGYLVLLGYLATWLVRAPRRLARAVPEGREPRTGAIARLEPRSPTGAMVLKDLRIASRVPGYAFIVLLPLIDALVLGLSTYVGTPSAANVFNLGVAAVSTAAFLATFFGPAFFATEVMGYSYTRTLPLRPRTLLAGKVLLVLLVYTLAATIVVAFTLARVFSPLIFLAFILAELPALSAAALLEFGILYRVSERRGLPLTNLYTGAWWATIVVIPGLVVIGLPLAAFGLIAAHATGITLMALASLAELAVVFLLTLYWTAGRAR